MLKKLNIEARLSRIRNDPNLGGERQALSKALWGFFIFERYMLGTGLLFVDDGLTVVVVVFFSIVASGYFQASSLSPPGLDVTGALPDTSLNNVAPTPPFERADSSQSSEILTGDRIYIPALHGYLDACADIARLLYESMRHNADYNSDTGSAEDLRTRRGLYSRVSRLSRYFPAALRPETNLGPQTCLLR
jgi:hypothetical protein